MNVYEAYLKDFCQLVLEEALRARESARTAQPGGFESGRARAYYEVVSLLQQQAVAFQIPPEKLSLAGVEPERDLI